MQLAVQLGDVGSISTGGPHGFRGFGWKVSDHNRMGSRMPTEPSFRLDNVFRTCWVRHFQPRITGSEKESQGMVGYARDLRMGVRHDLHVWIDPAPLSASLCLRFVMQQDAGCVCHAEQGVVLCRQFFRC